MSAGHPPRPPDTRPPGPALSFPQRQRGATRAYPLPFQRGEAAGHPVYPAHPGAPGATSSFQGIGVMDHSSSAASSPLRITSDWQDGCRIVTAAGQVDLSNTHQLHYALSTALRHDRPLIADLTAVTFLDSQGLRTLLTMQRNAELQDARLIIVPSPEIAALIRLGAADALTVSPSLSTALSTATTNDTPAPDAPTTPQRPSGEHQH